MRAVAEMLRDESIIAYLVSGSSSDETSDSGKADPLNKLTSLKKLGAVPDN
jgi:hypothetical protein